VVACSPMGSMAEPTSPVPRPRNTVERAETTLEDGTKLAVELSGARATRAAAAAGLAGARAAIDRKAPVSPDSASAQGDTGYLGLVGRSAPMQELFHMMDRIKGSEATILVTGENGTG